VQELLRNKGARDRLGKTVGQAVHAKRRVDRNIQILLSLLNVPSRADYDRLLHKVEALQGSLVNLNMKLDRLLAAAAERQASRRRPQRAARVERGHPKPSA
jgi:polyhydroxyalkanoate synthesis regulator phasin